MWEVFVQGHILSSGGDALNFPHSNSDSRVKGPVIAYYCTPIYSPTAVLYNIMWHWLMTHLRYTYHFNVKNNVIYMPVLGGYLVFYQAPALIFWKIWTTTVFMVFIKKTGKKIDSFIEGYSTSSLILWESQLWKFKTSPETMRVWCHF
jgi:hypothetical protein